MSRQEERIIELLEQILQELQDSSGGDNPLCGYNDCQRTVDSSDERCWQHSDE